MKTQFAFHHRLVGAAVVALAFATQLSAWQIAGASIPGGCADPPKSPSAVGCYLIATRPIEKLPDEPVFWHLYSYPTVAAAEAAKSESSSAVAESFDRVWLFTIASEQWRRLARRRWVHTVRAGYPAARRNHPAGGRLECHSELRVGGAAGCAPRFICHRARELIRGALRPSTGTLMRS
jgi:hypothetical protein